MTGRRRTGRWLINWQSKLMLEGAQRYADCCVNDINFKGMRITLALKLPIDTFLKLSLVLCEDLCLDIEAWIAWHRTIGGFYSYGVYFSKIKDQDKEKIYQFVRNNFPKQISTHLWEGLKTEGGEIMQEQKFEDRRIFERFSAKLPLKFINLKENKEEDALTSDVSAKGLGFVSRHELQPRTPLEMWIKVPDQGEPLYTRGEAVWSRMVEPNKYRVGVNLERADLMGLSRIMRVI